MFATKQGKWKSELGILRDVLIIVICEPKEALDFAYVRWGWPLRDNSHFGGVRFDTFSRHQMSQVLDLVNTKPTFAAFHVEPVLSQLIKHPTQMAFVFLFIP